MASYLAALFHSPPSEPDVTLSRHHGSPELIYVSWELVAYCLQDLFGGLHSHTFQFFKLEFLTPFAL